MKRKLNNPPMRYLFSRQLNLSDFGLEKQFINRAKRLLKSNEINSNFNKLVKFIEKTYYYANIVFPRYSNEFSKKLYSQPALFTILAMKIYTKSTYREIIDLISVSSEIKRFLRIKKAPHFTTIQKFFQKLSERKLKDINKLILSENVKKCDMIALDGTGFTNDYADKYYAKIRKKERKSYVKNHITIDVDSRFILHYMVQRGPNMIQISQYLQ